MKNYKIIAFVLFAFLVCGLSMSVETNESTSPVVDKEVLLAQHNFYRDQVGVAHLEWSEELAVYARNWANKLAKSCNLNHSSGGYGENIYWTSSTG